MQSLKKLRSELDLSQLRFSRLLGISSGLVALVETGKRSLPAHAQQIVMRLNLLVSTAPILDPENKIELDATSQKKIDRKIRVQNQRLRKNRFLLEDCLVKMESLKKLAALGEEPELENLWLAGSIEKSEWELLLRKNAKKISTLSYKIILLKMSISGLEAGIKTAEENNF